MFDRGTSVSAESQRRTAPFTRRAMRSAFDPVEWRRLASGEEGRFILPVEPDEEFTVALERVRKRGRGTFTLVGKVEGRPESSVLLVSHKGCVSGHVALYDEQRHYELQSIDGQNMFIRLQDAEAPVEPCGTADHLDLSDPDEPIADIPLEQQLIEEQATVEQVSAVTVMDLVVGYGREARIAEGGRLRWKRELSPAWIA